jgi:hypothetical protein
MGETFKDKLQETGHKLSETATKIGHTVSEKAEQAVDWTKEKAHQAGNTMEELGEKAKNQAEELTAKARDAIHNVQHGERKSISEIAEHMSVYASCGKQVGTVDHVEGDTIRLTKSGSPDGMHHRIPLGWVDHVDNHVHLSKNSKEVETQWQPA